MNEAKPSCGWNEAAPELFRVSEIRAKPDFELQTLTFEQETASKRVFKEIYDFKEERIRQFLIALGWTPPQSTE